MQGTKGREGDLLPDGAYSWPVCTAWSPALPLRMEAEEARRFEPLLASDLCIYQAVRVEPWALAGRLPTVPSESIL